MVEPTRPADSWIVALQAVSRQERGAAFVLCHIARDGRAMKKIKLNLDCTPEEAARRALLYSNENNPPLDGYVSVNPATIIKLPIVIVFTY